MWVPFNSLNDPLSWWPCQDPEGHSQEGQSVLREWVGERMGSGGDGQARGERSRKAGSTSKAHGPRNVQMRQRQGPVFQTHDPQLRTGILASPPVPRGRARLQSPALVLGPFPSRTPATSSDSTRSRPLSLPVSVPVAVSLLAPSLPSDSLCAPWQQRQPIKTWASSHLCSALPASGSPPRCS